MSSLRVMLIDDDEIVLKLAALTLQREGHVVRGFRCAHEAIDAFRAAPSDFDLVLCDIHLDSGSGYELAETLARIHAGAPVLLTSGVVGEEERQRGRRAGAREVLPKAQVLTDLGRVVRQFCDLR